MRKRKATAFAIFISSVLDRNINLVTSGISIITCILAGCFVSISSANRILTTLSNVLPQKSYMEIVHGIEFGGHLADYGGELLYLLFFALAFIIVAVSLVKPRTAKGIY